MESAAAPAAAPRKPRAAWVDAARSLAMYPIIWMHAGAAPNGVGEWVGGALCLFFLLAGYFMPQEWRPCLKRAGKLALAWALWSCIAALLYFAMAPEHGIRWEKLLGWGEASYDTPLWFLRNLAVYQGLMALLLALRVLPHYGWLLTAVLACCAYASAPSQHLTLRFDWFWVLLLGFCLKAVPLPRLEDTLRRHLPLLLGSCVFLLLQPMVLHTLLPQVAECSLPVGSFARCGLYFAAAYILCRCSARLGRGLAAIGSGMMFCYVTHSFFLVPFYLGYDFNWAWNAWVPLLLLPLLTALGAALTRCFPRTMAVLQGK